MSTITNNLDFVLLEVREGRIKEADALAELHRMWAQQNTRTRIEDLRHAASDPEWAKRTADNLEGSR